jgi:broad-specificity NMP kinase
LLLNEGVSNQFGKKKAKAKEDAQAMGLDEVIIDLDQFSDSDDDEELEAEQENDLSHSHVADFVEEEAIVLFKEKTLEDIIEEQRARLAAQGKVGTPVTAETFAIWRAAKLAKRQADAEARMKELSKKKGGAKALCESPSPALSLSRLSL